MKVDDNLIGKMVKIVALDHFTATKELLDKYDEDSWLALTTYGILKHIYKDYIVLNSRTIGDNEDEAYMGDIHFLLKSTITELTVLEEKEHII